MIPAAHFSKSRPGRAGLPATVVGDLSGHSTRPTSTKRRLVRYTVEVPAPTVCAIIASGCPCSAANRICARLTRRTRALPPPVNCCCNSARSSSLSSTMYRMFIGASIGAVETVDHGTLAVSIPPSPAARFTERQGQYLAFIHAYTKVNGRPPAQADLQRFFTVTAPSVHQMLLALERRGGSPNPRTSAQYRGARRARGPSHPTMTNPIQSIKTSVQRY